MNAHHTWKIVLCGLSALLLIGTAALACDWWCVQGVIDWGSVPPTSAIYGPTATVHKVYDGRWDPANDFREVRWDLAAPPPEMNPQPTAAEWLQMHAARDGFVFLPRDGDFNKPVTFGTLAGAGVLRRGAAAASATIDWYEVWAWADINGNGEADAYDQLDGAPQNWVMLFHKAGAPGPYDPVAGTADISNLLKDVQTNQRQLQDGIYYLLLLRVHATRSETDSGTSLQFTDPLSRVGEKVQLGQTAKLPTEGWSATEWPAKYISKAGNDKGVDDFEVLWVRVNNPPRGPRH